jgi:hypothetical protein
MHRNTQHTTPQHNIILPPPCTHTHVHIHIHTLHRITSNLNFNGDIIPNHRTDLQFYTDNRLIFSSCLKPKFNLEFLIVISFKFVLHKIIFFFTEKFIIGVRCTSKNQDFQDKRIFDHDGERKT